MTDQSAQNRTSSSPNQNERAEEELNPHRREEQLRAAEEASNRLQARGIQLTGEEGPDALADLQDAVERFEAAVESRGGDLMMDDLRSSQPEAPELVLPQRETGEPIEAYTARIDAAAAGLKAGG